MSSNPRVVDFSTHLSGPLTSHYLAEMGADVVKVEHWHVGDGNRGVEPFINGTGMIHVNCAPGTRSMAADPRSPHWPDVVAACARWADVVIVGSRPVDAAKRGLDFASLRAQNERIVYCSVNGYGAHGPWSDRPAHGLQMDAYAGTVPVEWLDGQPRVAAGFRTAGTTAAAIFSAMGIWAALFRREREGGSLFVETSCWGAAVSWNWRDVTTLANLDHGWPEYADNGTRYAMYATSDGRALLLCPLERKFWESLCDLLDLPELRERGNWDVNGMDWGAGPEYAAERPLLEQRIAARPLVEWDQALTAIGVPFAPMLTLSEAISGDHARANGVLGETTVGTKQSFFTRAPVHVGRDVAMTVEDLCLAAPPEIGENTDEVLEEIGVGHLRGIFPRPGERVTASMTEEK